MTTSFERGAAAVLALNLAAACDQPGAAGLEQLALPKPLREVSGLVAAPDGRLLAIADETGSVYAIDFERARIEQRAGFGEPPVKEDFEGLAVKGGVLYATTSRGELYSRALDEPDPNVFERRKTGLGKQCEIEGLAAHAAHDHVWFLCKEPRKKRHEGNLTLLAWSIAGDAPAPEHDLAVPYAKLGFKKAISPSGVSFTEDGRELWIVAARQQAFVTTTLPGELLRNGRLPNRQWHPQTEGIAISGGSIYLADEGGKGRGTVSRYKDGF